MLKRATYLIPLLIGILLAAVITLVYRADEERNFHKARLEVFYKLSSIQSGFENTLNSKLNLTKALKSVVALRPDINQEEFEHLASTLTADVSGILFLELARDNVITHIFPKSTSTRIVGRSLIKDFPADIRDLTLQAMKTQQSQITVPRTTLEGGEAIIAANPIYLESSEKGGVQQYWGLAAVLIDTKTLYREAGLIDVSPGLDLALRDPEAVEGKNDLLLGKQAVFDRNPVVMNIPIPSGYWQVGAVPSRGWPASTNAPYIVGGGLIGTLMIMASLWAALFMIHGRLDEREKYRYLVQNAKSIILRIDMAGNIVFCNEHAEEFYGYETGELLGRPLIGTLIPEKNLQGESMKRYISRLLKNPSAHPFNETMNVCKNGEIVWVAWAHDSVLGRDGRMVELLSVGTDITDRKLMEEALRQSEKQHRLLAENVSDIIWGLDTDSRVTFVSPSDEALRGFKRYDVLSRPIGDFLTPASDRLLNHTIDVLENQAATSEQPPSATLDLEFTCSDGSTVWLETHLGILLSEDGEKIGMQGVSRDITDRKLAEALRDDVERMARHDLKTPLGAVTGLPAEIRRLGALSAAQEGMLATIEDAGNSMLQLINRSLDLFKMEQGTYLLKKTTIDVLQVLEQIKTETRPVVRKKGISVGIEVQGGLRGNEFWTTAEGDMFKSMLSNLILNAMQASPEGGSVSIVLERSEGLTITIRNQGEVSESMREVFFDKYASSNGSSGSGLGTYSARLIARTHGGDIVVKTCMPGETCVIVTLPE